MARISNITLPNNSTYDLGQATNIETIRGTQAAATGVWTGVTTDSELYDGKTIIYYLPFAGSGNATLNLTLSTGSTTGAKNVYFQGTTRMTTHYGQYSQVELVYHKAFNINGTNYEGWWSLPGRDTNNDTYDRTRFNQAIKAKSAIVAANIVVAKDNSGYFHLKTGAAFDISYPILYANAAINASATGTNNYIVVPFTVTTTQSLTLTAYKMVYIKGTLSGTTFTPVSTAPLTQTIPSSSDGYQYLRLGYAYSTTALYLIAEHPIFEFSSGIWHEITDTVDKLTVSFSDDRCIITAPTSLVAFNDDRCILTI